MSCSCNKYKYICYTVYGLLIGGVVHEVIELAKDYIRLQEVEKKYLHLLTTLKGNELSTEDDNVHICSMCKYSI